MRFGRQDALHSLAPLGARALHRANEVDQRWPPWSGRRAKWKNGPVEISHAELEAMACDAELHDIRKGPKALEDGATLNEILGTTVRREVIVRIP